MTNGPTTIHPLLGTDFTQVRTRYDEAERTLWVYMAPEPRPCFTEQMLKDLIEVQRRILEFNRAAGDGGRLPVEYAVVASTRPNVWSFGGDLELFSGCVEGGRPEDLARLRRYATDCIDVGYWNASGGENKPFVISLVQGEALGGGFEGAISAGVVIAEEQATFGLPEVLFSLFPGMGAWTYLSRRVGPAMAERMILSGEMYSAHRLCELGVVTEVTGRGEGELATVNFIQQHRRRANTHRSMRRIRTRWDPVPYEELADITEEWVQAAQRLTSRDLRLMGRLLRAQDTKLARELDAAAN